MDEAERCHRLAILQRGRVVAEGSPRALMEAMPHRALQVECTTPRRAQLALEGVPGVRSLAQIGVSLRVLADGGEEVLARIRGALGAAGVEARVEPTAPNLEDVFVAATRGARDGVGG
jgi:ABC-2 type transport system ATP-binding protein